MFEMQNDNNLNEMNEFNFEISNVDNNDDEVENLWMFSTKKINYR